MDLLGASIFGLIVLNELRHKGVHNKKRQVQCIFKAGLIAACGLALVYSGLLYLGATTSGVPEDMSRADLLVAIAFNLLGREGTVILAVAVSMACLTTAIGLTVVCGQYFRNLSQGKLRYKLVCALVAAISLILSNAGVASIVKMAVIPLVALYPIVMVLVIFTLLGSRINRRRVWRGAVLGAFAVGVMEALRRAGWQPAGVDWVYSYLPLAGSGLGWVLPAFFMGFLGAINISKGRPIIQISQSSPDYNP
jgi:LIVCS family branched-chain amino acid:cation transporter